MAAKTAGTWAVIEPSGIGDITAVDTTQLYPLGTICRARDMGATAYGDASFIYLAGGSNVVRGSVCIITDAWAVTEVAARSIGAVCVALAAVDSATTKWGWFQILGKGVVKCDGVAAAAPCYVDGTAGRIDDSAVTGDQVIGMRTVSTDDTNTCVVNMAARPYIADFDNA